ncbi:MAG: diacylglyceryl transferase [Flavobacteriales bacterium]|nr:diacylglyceryl transferase [Flavobacteriales bacterium]|tara:strand:- start:40103 stop:41266 length:1164 start_codon:yes stop_codon:yes gene_type:complete
MYPTVSDMIKDLFGLEIPLPFPTFGFFVALAFLVAAYLFTLELKRKEQIGWLKSKRVKEKIGEKASTGELISNGFIGFILGFKLVEAFSHYSELVADPQGFIFSTRGNFIGGIVGAALFAYLKYREKKKEELPTPKLVEKELHPHELVGNMTMIAAIAGILGAKIFHNLENLDEFAADPIGALISFSGLSIYGGLIVGGGAVLWYAAKHGLKWVHVADACAPGLMAAYGVGRIGCQLAGDGDWGQPNDAPKPEWMSFLPDWMWAYDYPNNVLGINLQEDFQRMGYESLTGNAWPTPFYETVMATIIFAILWSLRKKIAIPGFIFSLYLSLNGVERFLIEKIRINPDYQFLGIEATQAELIAITMFIAGIAGMIYFSKNKEKYTPKLT